MIWHKGWLQSQLPFCIGGRVILVWWTEVRQTDSGQFFTVETVRFMCSWFCW